MEDNSSMRYCQLCHEVKQNTIQLKCDHIICELCLETQKLYITESCFLCICVKWL